MTFKNHHGKIVEVLSYVKRTLNVAKIHGTMVIAAFVHQTIVEMEYSVFQKKKLVKSVRIVAQMQPVNVNQRVTMNSIVNVMMVSLAMVSVVKTVSFGITSFRKQIL